MEWLQIFGWSLYCTPFWTGLDIIAKRAFRAWNHSRKMPVLLLNAPDWTHFFPQAHPCIAGWYFTAPGLADPRSKSAAGLKFCCQNPPCTGVTAPSPSTPQAHSPRHTWLEYQLSPLHSDVCSWWPQPLEAPPAPHLQGTKTPELRAPPGKPLPGERSFQSKVNTKKNQVSCGLRAISAARSDIPSWNDTGHSQSHSHSPGVAQPMSRVRNTWFIPGASRWKYLTRACDPTCSTPGPQIWSWTFLDKQLWESVKILFHSRWKRVSQLWCLSKGLSWTPVPDRKFQSVPLRQEGGVRKSLKSLYTYIYILFYFVYL